MERISADDQRVFEAAFRRGLRRFTADLLVFFYARALQILRDGGWLAFVTSNKYMRAAYGRGLREQLARHTSAYADHRPRRSAGVRLQRAVHRCLSVSGDRSPRNGGGRATRLKLLDLTWPVRHELAAESKRTVKPDNGAGRAERPRRAAPRQSRARLSSSYCCDGKVGSSKTPCSCGCSSASCP